ncbi:MAG: diguanylate cyclase with and sensor [Phycisphaerales bacterium]|nr:diguanylate cyclase with and sensor [Phycisphaerales bacterium]
MGRLIRNMSLAGQIFSIAGFCLVLTAGGALVTTHAVLGERGAFLRLELIAVLCAGALVSIGIIMIAVRRLLLDPLATLDQHLARLIEGTPQSLDEQPMPSRELQRVKSTIDRMVGQMTTARGHYEDAQRVLASRTSTVDQLLEFSQTIQGAGAVGQVFSSLSHYLRTELSLAGVAIISNQPDETPAMQVRAAWPETVVRKDAPVADMEAAACPCLRQHLPKCFRLNCSPVRCAIDSCLTLGPEYPAYCIPFNVGRKMQVVVHMMLPVDESWTEDRKQLAQTYVNTAVSTLISLDLLAEAEKQSLTDGLTGLYNRRSMESLLQREVALSERHGHPLALVMIDMDRFKQINDDHGHAAGDHMLKSFADCVRITLRKTDLAFRYGGDEFVIALPQTAVPQAIQVVQKLRQAFGAVDFSHAIARLEQQPTLSMGVVERSIPQNIVTLQNLLAAADQALYEAKSANRNCVKIYAPPKAA